MKVHVFQMASEFVLNNLKYINLCYLEKELLLKFLQVFNIHVHKV